MERDPLNQELDDLRIENAKLKAAAKEMETKLEAAKKLAVDAIALIKF